jgi:hypothetical protein
LRKRFETERTGDQDLFTEQTKLLQPLINTQEQTEKAIRGNKDVSLSVLTKELQRRNDQFDLLSEQPFYQYEIEPGLPAIKASKPASKPRIEINLDSGLSDIDKTNLKAMHLKLPSEVFENKAIEETLAKIKTVNRTHGQHLRPDSTVSAKDREKYVSQRKTSQIYKQIVEGLEGAQQFVGKGLKKKKITEVVLYKNTEDLCSKLEQLNAAKQAGNTGLDNSIISILDELLRVRAISKNEFDELYKNILHT